MSSTSGHTGTTGVRRIEPIPSRKTWLRDGRPGRVEEGRRLGDGAERGHGPAAQRRQPLPRLAGREGDEVRCRVLRVAAGGEAVGVGVQDRHGVDAARHRCDVEVETGDLSQRRDLAPGGQQHPELARHEAGLQVLGRELLLGRHRALAHQVDHVLHGLARRRLVEGEPGRLLEVVDDVAAVRPHEGREADDARIDARATDLSGRELSRGRDEVVPRPVVGRLGQAGSGEDRPVVVDDEGRHVLRHALELAVVGERIDGLVVVGRQVDVALRERLPRSRLPRRAPRTASTRGSSPGTRRADFRRRRTCSASRGGPPCSRSRQPRPSHPAAGSRRHGPARRTPWSPPALPRPEPGSAPGTRRRPAPPGRRRRSRSPR